MRYVLLVLAAGLIAGPALADDSVTNGAKALGDSVEGAGHLTVSAAQVGLTASVLPAAVGASFAHREIDKSRICINIQNDGDSMYAPGALWTASHHKVPMLTIMWNNRAYHQEIMHLQRMANWRQRDVSTAYIGTTIRNPFVQYEKLAESMGVTGIGPITDPKDLGAAIKRGVEAVKAGEPVLINVVTQPR